MTCSTVSGPMQCSLWLMAIILILAGCEEVRKQMPVGTDRYLQSGMNIGSAIANRPKFTEADEERMAQENAKKYEHEHTMWDDPLLDVYLGDIVQRLAAGAHPRPFTYSIRVVKDSAINAFTFGGGILYVNAGLLARMENEAQLAMVLAHEIAHVTESHVARGIENNYNTQLVGQVAGQAAAASGKIPLTPGVFRLTYDYSMKAAVSGHGRASESEADVIGLEYLVKGGYDPREAPRTFEQLLKEYGDQGTVQNFFYGDHPTNKARIEKLSDLTRSKYSQDLESRNLITNTTEFKQRTHELVVLVGQMDYERKRFQTASTMFEKALQVKPDDPVPHYWLGKIALETGREDQAIAHLTTALSGEKKPIEAYRELGLAYYKKRDAAKAIEAFEQYLKVAPHAKDAERIKKSIEDLKRT
jgi:predicted Zn-dependent protease